MGPKKAQPLEAPVRRDILTGNISKIVISAVYFATALEWLHPFDCCNFLRHRRNESRQRFVRGGGQEIEVYGSAMQSDDKEQSFHDEWADSQSTNDAELWIIDK